MGHPTEDGQPQMTAGGGSSETSGSQTPEDQGKDTPDATESLVEAQSGGEADIAQEERSQVSLEKAMQWLFKSQQHMMGQLQTVEQQNQVVMDRVMNLNASVITQSQRMEETRQSLQNELGKFQRGGPQRAMVNVFSKLFRDLIDHMNQMDDLLTEGEDIEEGAGSRGWRGSIAVLRDHFQSILEDWGVVPIAIAVGEDPFDPEIHEAVTAMNGDIPESIPENIIVKVHRRGWSLNETILQYPQVVVS